MTSALLSSEMTYTPKVQAKNDSVFIVDDAKKLYKSSRDLFKNADKPTGP
ncbi:hypothetical protein KIPB_010792, partial [Kipferlia bialata]|eukprot:g10792.t1